MSKSKPKLNYSLRNPIPTEINGADIAAESLKSAIDLIFVKYPNIQRFSVVSPSEKIFHYKTKNKKAISLAHRDFDHLTIDRLKEMLRDAGLTPPSLKSNQLDWVDNNEEYVRSWLARRELMTYLGDDFSIETNTKEGLIVTREADYFVLQPPKGGKGFVNSYIKLIDTKDKFKALAESRKEELDHLKNSNAVLTELVKECLEELKEFKSEIAKIDESMKNLRGENLGLKSELTLATFRPIGPVIEGPKNSSIFDELF